MDRWRVACKYTQGKGLAKDYDGEGVRPDW
jgi:hypothetical protein